jgi:hypothetical protein
MDQQLTARTINANSISRLGPASKTKPRKGVKVNHKRVDCRLAAKKRGSAAEEGKKREVMAHEAEAEIKSGKAQGARSDSIRRPSVRVCMGPRRPLPYLSNLAEDTVPVHVAFVAPSPDLQLQPRGSCPHEMGFFFRDSSSLHINFGDLILRTVMTSGGRDNELSVSVSVGVNTVSRGQQRSGDSFYGPTRLSPPRPRPGPPDVSRRILGCWEDDWRAW